MSRHTQTQALHETPGGALLLIGGLVAALALLALILALFIV